MASTTDREIIGDLRHKLNMRLRQHYPDTDGVLGFRHTTEAYFVGAIYGIDARELRADYYIAPGDGGGPIVVEVGAIEDAKWEALVSTDREPVRVLRVGSDHLVSLSHPRHTKFEGDLLSALEPTV